MAKCLWCLKELGIFGMLFHKAVCLEYLYSKSLDKLKQAKQSQLITKEQYMNEKRNLREYFMSRFKPKVYEAFIKRQKEQQQILINPNELSVGLESDIEVISKKVCVDSQEISQKSLFSESFQNQIDHDYKYILDNYQEVQPIYITNQQIVSDNSNNNDQQLHINKHNHDHSQDQFIQLNIIQQQINDDTKEKLQTTTPQSNEDQKENILFKLLQNRAYLKQQNTINKSISQNQNIKQTNTKSQSRKIKEAQQNYDTKAETNKSPILQEQIPTDIKSIGFNVSKTNIEKPPKFSQSSDLINQQFDISQRLGLKKKSQRNINKIQKISKCDIFTNERLNNCKVEVIQKGMIKTRFQASLEKLESQTKTDNIKKRDQQKIKKK